MESKLTLKLDEAVIDQAKKYAVKRKTSLSKLVEEYFKELSGSESRQPAYVHPVVREISGIISADGGISLEDEYSAYLEKKYE
ncbi:MAG TPA: DUF6364 family protein [Magnetospirillaceae bacterium]|nr:DUF6364 family protein [Magnetospirillaceae bacterium]